MSDDIVTRLRQTRADMIGTDDEAHYWDCHDAAAEIERQRQLARLTDAEREAVRFCSEFCRLGDRADLAATLRGLLERMQ